jgi:GAF domain-containing protein/CheY-like chemotaxis protein
MHATREALRLRQRVAARLRPLALSILVIVGLGLPLTYYALDGYAGGDHPGLYALTGGLAFVSAVVAAVLALLVYRVPMVAVSAMEQRMETLIAEQESLVEAGRVLAGTLDLREVLDRLTGAARALPGVDVVRIWLCDEASGEYVLHSEAGVQDTAVKYVTRLAPGTGLIGRVLSARRPLTIEDIHADPAAVNREWLASEGLVSYLGVPLLLDDVAVGALAFMARQPHAWSAADVALAETLGTLAAVTIRNARLFAQSEARRRAAEGLAATGRAVSQGLDLDEIAQRIADSACTLLAAEWAGLYRLEPRSGDLISVAVSGDAGGLAPRTFILPKGTGAAGLAVHERRAVVTPNVLADRRIVLSAEERARIETATFRAVLAVPLQVKNRVVGALGVGARAGRVFERNDIELAQALADQAALALENARLFREATRRRREAEQLAQIGRMLTETLDMTAVGQRIVDSLLPLFGAHSSGLFLIEGNGAPAAVAWGGAARDHWNVGEALDNKSNVAALAIASGDPAWSRDVLADSRLALSEAIRRRVLATGDRAALAAPLRAKGAVIGALVLADRIPRDFAVAEVELVQALADQAALALENARLYARAQRAYAELTEAQAQLVRSETLRAMGELAAGVAHHLNNLLAVVLGRIQLVIPKTEAPEARRDLALAERAALDGADVVRRMRGFSRGYPAPSLIAVDLSRLAAEAVEMTRSRWSGEATARGIRIETTLEAGAVPAVAGEPAALREVLVNLILNAIDALPAGGRIALRTWASGEHVHCAVSDDGIGMSPEVQRRAVEPFFTTKGVRRTGLGLSVGYGILRRHGGDLTIESTEGQGTEVTLRVPLTSLIDIPGTAPVASAVRAPAGRLTVVVVDDEPEVRRVIAELLEHQGHRVVQAADGDEALRRVDDTVDLVLTDLSMPGMSGWDVARDVKTRWPGLRVGIVTGWAEALGADPGHRSAADFVIAKPVTGAALRTAIAQAGIAPRH